MIEIKILYVIMVLWVTPWVIALIYLMYKFKKLINKINKFLDDISGDEEEDLRDLKKQPLGVRLKRK